MNCDISGCVFMGSYGGGHAAALAPVLTELINEGTPVRYLALTTARRQLEQKGLPCIGMAELHQSAPAYRSVRRTGRLLARQQTNHVAVPAHETEAYLGVGFHALVREHGLRSARQRVERLGRQCFLPIDFFVSLFSYQRPSMVVATSAPRAERAMLEAARLLGIPSVCVVDLYAPYEIEWCATKNYASAFCVLNEAVKARFIRAGVPSDRIFPTGNPSFDRLAHIDKVRTRQAARARLGLKESDRLVAWISQPEPSKHPFSSAEGDPTYPQNVERALADFFSIHPNISLVMRLHPSENRPPSVQGNRIRYSDSTEPLDELLCSADCIITASSTVGLEAALLNVPVIQCMDSIFSLDLPLASLGLATAAATYAEAGRIALTVMEIGSLEGKLDYQCDGGSAARIAQTIHKLAS